MSCEKERRRTEIVAKQEQLKQALQTLALMRSLEQQQAKLRASLQEIEEKEQEARLRVDTCTQEYTTWSAKQAELKNNGKRKS